MLKIRKRIKVCNYSMQPWQKAVGTSRVNSVLYVWKANGPVSKFAQICVSVITIHMPTYMYMYYTLKKKLRWCGMLMDVSINLPLVVGQHWIRSLIACERSLNQNLCPREGEERGERRGRAEKEWGKRENLWTCFNNKNSQASYLLSSRVHQLLSTFPLPPHTYMYTPTLYTHTLVRYTYTHNNS